MSSRTSSAKPSNVDHLPCLLNSRIGNDRFHLQRRLGSGGFSIVYLATDLSSRRRRQVAVKCLAHKSREQRSKNMREVSLHRRAARLPGVVDLYDIVEENGLLFLILQYCDSGDLFSLITEDKLFFGRDDLIKNAFVQLLETVRDLHSMGIYHRDLKPENVLSTHKGSRLLIADFGLATVHSKSSTFGCGSHFYMTPESLAGYYFANSTEYSTRAADFWALGIILINLITTRSPWDCAIPTDPSFEQYIRNPLWLRQSLPLSQSAFSFVNRIFFKHGVGITHGELIDRFYRINTFSMTGEELMVANKTAKAIANERTKVDSVVIDDFSSLSEDYDNDADRTLVDDTESGVDGFKTKTSTLEKVSDDASTANVNTLFVYSLQSLTPGPKDIFTAAAIVDNSDNLSVSSSDSDDSELLITPENAPILPVDGVRDLNDDDNLTGTLEEMDQTELARAHGPSKQVSFYPLFEHGLNTTDIYRTMD